MILRDLQAKIQKYLKIFPAVAILGPRQVGKTTLVKALTKGQKRKVLYLDLEKEADVRLLKKDAQEFLSHYADEVVVIDEVQRIPKLFVLLRPLIDEKRKPSRFILTGSASPELMKGASESLAGRIIYTYLFPINISELPANISLRQHWLRGGFPVSLIARNKEVADVWFDSFITAYIERDLSFIFDFQFSAPLMKRMWGMLAHLQSQLLNIEDLGRSLDVSATTVRRYLDYLEGAFIIHRLPPYHVNMKKRLVKTPKIYILDSGLVHRLLNIDSTKELISSPYVGASWEGYVMSQIYYAKSEKLTLYFYRTHDNAECDLVITKGHLVKACVEIKYSRAPSLTKGFYQSITDLKSTNNFVICQTDHPYKNKDGIHFTNLQTFIQDILPSI
ncbi:ATPase [Bacteroidota bacterium]|nr:ATPase [Bacteroidota bacterium]